MRSEVLDQVRLSIYGIDPRESSLCSQRGSYVSAWHLILWITALFPLRSHLLLAYSDADGGGDLVATSAIRVLHVLSRYQYADIFTKGLHTSLFDEFVPVEHLWINAGINPPELIKCLYEKIPRLMDEMYRVTTSFLQGEVAAFSHSRKKAPAPWRQLEEGNKPNFKKGLKNKQRSDRKLDRFSLLTKTPKEIFTLEKGKFKAPPPMVTPVEKIDPNKYCKFHADTGHSTDECMQLRKQIDKMIKSGKLSQFSKELKQNDKPKAQKKGEMAGKDKPLAILMIQQWERVAKQRVTQSFSPEIVISFPSFGEEDGTEGPMIIEAEIGGHFVHQIYVDGGASS
ncbi:hypothetical protein Tco_0097134 [Tanacetum coccineum]